MAARFRIAPRREVTRQDWESFAAASNGAWIWHTNAVIDALATWQRFEDCSFAVVSETGALVAIVPLHEVKDRMVHVVRAGRLVSTGGPALRNDLGGRERREAQQAVVDEFDRLMTRRGASWTEASMAPMTPSLRQGGCIAANPLVEFGLHDSSQTTWVVDLSRGEAQIRADYSQLTRRTLRKAQEQPFAIRKAEGQADMKTYYSLHTETCARTGAAPMPEPYIEALFRDLVPTGLARIMFLERQDRVVATQNTGEWKGGAVYWSGASRDDREGGDNRLLFDAQIMASRANGCAFYETGQAFPMTSDGKEKGLSDFKSSFGARLARYPAGRRYVGSRVGRLVAGLRVARAIWRGSPA